MQLRNATVHMLVKEQREAIQPNVYREDLLDVDTEEVALLAQRLVETYGKKENSAQYGVFRTDDGRGDFPDKFIEYVNDNLESSHEFDNISREIMQKLFEKAEDSPLATGGHIIFIDYEENKSRFLLITMVKQKEGMTVNEALEPQKLLQIDFSKLHNAARININRLLSSLEPEADEDQTYLSFISQKSAQQAAGYFIKALGCSAGLASARATSTLFKESNKLFKDDERLIGSADNFQQSLREYVKSCITTPAPIRLTDIKHLVQQSVPIDFADEAEDIAEEFVTWLNSEECAVPAEFQPNESSAKKYLSYRVKAVGWELIANKELVGSDPEANIYYDSDNKTITIRNVPDDFQLD